MAPYTKERGREFWFDFDNQTLWRRTDEVNRAIQQIAAQTGGLDEVVDLFRLSFAQPNHPQPFLDSITPVRDAFLSLANAQLAIFRKHFDNDQDAWRSAYVDFGQGVLFDDRDPRGEGHFIHMMDGSPDDWVGYHRWSAFVRAVLLLGADPEVWLPIYRFIALAWGIQTEADPVEDSPDNRGLAPNRLKLLSDFWLAQPAQMIDSAFTTYRTRAPRPENLRSRRAPKTVGFGDRIEGTHYAEVTDIMERAAGSGRPRHGGFKRFWTLPLADFLKIQTIYGVELIAPVGADRGARSGMIKALKGEPPFGPGGRPRMPLNRPPVPDNEIAYIQRWIDEGLPE